MMTSTLLTAVLLAEFGDGGGGAQPLLQPSVAPFVQEMAKATNPDDVFAAYSKKGGEKAMRISASAQSGVAVAEIAAEALQILGQIVVDRATMKAYTLIKQRLEKLLDCDNVKSPFVEVCKVLAPLRLEDLATTPGALEAALVADVLKALGTTNVDPRWLAVFTQTIQPIILHPGQPLSAADANALIQQLMGLGIDPLRVAGKKYCTLASAQQRALALASLALVQCRAQVIESQGGVSMVDCQIGEIVGSLNGNAACPLAVGSKELTAARSIATHSLGAIVVDKTPDSARVRFLHAVHALFDTADLLSGTSAAPVLKLMKQTTFAVMDRDTNSLLNVAWQGIAMVQTGQSKTDTKRALALVGALLQYAQTYTAPVATSETDPAKVAAASHQRRTEILESLTQEMSNRIGRENDAIFSLGGTLRLTGGARVGGPGNGQTGPQAAFFGPISLPLGFAFQSGRTKVCSSEGCPGFHFELNIVDLGQYVAFESKGTVAKPDPLAALAPSLGFGVYWGNEMPFTLTALFGFSPQYQFVADGGRGAVFFGLGLGVYVPLLDVN